MQVTPLHLMLFASRKIELLPSGLVHLDNWITLEVEPRAAAAIAALRPSLEALVIRCAAEPENIADPGHQEDRTIQVGAVFRIRYSFDTYHSIWLGYSISMTTYKDDMYSPPQENNFWKILYSSDSSLGYSDYDVFLKKRMWVHGCIGVKIHSK
jgi:hypothetical protein